MANAETAGWQPTREHLAWLAGALALVLAPHALRLPAWLSLGFLALAAWRVLIALRGWSLPPRWVRLLIVAATMAGVALSFGAVLGRDAGVALLVVLAGLKLLETQSLRDAYVCTFLGFFLVATNFLFSQSIAMGAYMIGVLLAMTATLITLVVPARTLAARQRLRLAAVLLVQAVPVAVALFVLFPRLPGPLWSLPKDAHAGVSGLGDSMSPGTVSQLGLSDAVAFRVRFDGPAPSPSALYWRGPVLWHTDGRTWSARRRTLLRQPPIVTGSSQPVDYEVTLEPHRQRWLLTLELPGELPSGTRVSSELEVLALRPVRERVRYRARSYPGARIVHLSANDAADALRLPRGWHPRARQLGQRWRAESDTASQIVQRALTYFREQPFHYTLRPPLLRGDSVDEFLFLSRRGFCEHYAAAFTVLMRAAGVPARVVTGYQGGELNPLGDYFIVRQRDAHAWAEVWLQGEGWLRVDPTAAVAPSRIESGFDAALPQAAGGLQGVLPAGDTLAGALRTLRHGWDTVNDAWNQWVLGYGPDRQRRTLQRFGLDVRNWRDVGAALLGSVGLLLAAVALWLWRRRRAPDPSARAYRRFCAQLARSGVVRRPEEGPLDFARRASAERPKLAGAIARVTELYVALRYADAGDPAELKRAVAAFRA